MKVLVCGGAGYIGAHMCKLLARSGHEVVVFDNLSTGYADLVRWGSLVRGDLLAAEDVERAFGHGPFDAVMHFAAACLVGESVERPDLYYRNNVTGTIALLDAMVRHGVPRVIFSSSCAVYGIAQYSPMDEAHPKQPANPYGRSKLMAEMALPDYEAAYGLKSVALRYFNAAGADGEAEVGERHEPETHLIPNILLSLLRGHRHPLRIHGGDYPTSDGTCVRDYVHVEDICMAHLQALAYLQNGGQSDAFNLGSARGYSVLEVVNAVQRLTGREVAYEITARRPGDPPTLVAASDKAKRVLGWTPRHDLDGIIATAWRWHRSRESLSN